MDESRPIFCPVIPVHFTETFGAKVASSASVFKHSLYPGCRVTFKGIRPVVYHIDHAMPLNFCLSQHLWDDRYCPFPLVQLVLAVD